MDVTAEELERLLLQKEGESMKDSQLQSRTPGGASGKRAIGKAVAKGGMLLKGRNPGNVCMLVAGRYMVLTRHFSSKGKKRTFVPACQESPMPTGKRSQRHRRSDKSTSISNIRVYFGCEGWSYYRRSQLTGCAGLEGVCG